MAHEDVDSVEVARKMMAAQGGRQGLLEMLSKVLEAEVTARWGASSAIGRTTV